MLSCDWPHDGIMLEQHTCVLPNTPALLHGIARIYVQCQARRVLFMQEMLRLVFSAPKPYF